jgi:hypothetical protein
VPVSGGFRGAIRGILRIMVEADFSSIGTAATGFGATAGRLRDVDVAGPLSSVQEALVGAQTAEACLWVATRLGSSVQVLADRVEALGRLATATVDSYDHTDSVHAGSFQRAAR